MLADRRPYRVMPRLVEANGCPVLGVSCTRRHPVRRL